MERIAQFEKVSLSQFLEDWHEFSPETGSAEAEKIYESIQMPRRATKGSAGYDFRAPVSFELAPGAEIRIPTGIRAKMDPGYVLMLFPRSSLGFRYRLQLNNTVGIIDSDYYSARNEGHIWCKLTNDTHEGKTVSLSAGDGMVQGIFLPFGITLDDEAEGERVGGFGSTDR